MGQQAEDEGVDAHGQGPNAAVGKNELAYLRMITAEFPGRVPNGAGQREGLTRRPARAGKIAAVVKGPIPQPFAKRSEAHVFFTHQKRIAQAVDNLGDADFDLVVGKSMESILHMGRAAQATNRIFPLMFSKGSRIVIFDCDFLVW